MSLVPGARVGPFEVLGVLGAGGMGEVYRARDTRLNRDVAVKVLPALLSGDPDRRARFAREATVLASLNHPNIAAVYGIEESAGSMVMELVEGDTLAERISQGPITVDEAVAIARQVAEALDAAHERGIIHRDLKPANIKVTPDGTVKVLDFGLAKASDSSVSGTGSDERNPQNSPTMTSPAMVTRAGVILGTAAYMSPEQARGRPVDKRADIWAFGCVLFEMLTGHPAFGGNSVSETLAAVMRDEPALGDLPASTPLHLRRLLARCFERDAKRRLRDIGEARIALDDTVAPRSTIVESPPAAGQPAARRRGVRRATPWIFAAAGLALAALFAADRRPAMTRESLELEIGPPPDAQFLLDTNSGNVLLSPDGTKIVFRAATPTRRSLWIRSLARDDAKPLAGTEDAQYPFWAPDSRRLAFFSAGKLKTLDTAAGLPQTIAEAPNGRGGSWGEDDLILFAPIGFGTISRVASSGGTAAPVTNLDTSRGENAHYWPLILPGGRKFLYFVRSFRPENSGIYVADIDGRNPVRLVSSLSSGIYAPPLEGGSGHLLWVQDGDLLAQPFDPDRAALEGHPLAVASGVRVLESQRGVLASVSRTGAVAWATSRAARGQFTWYDREGRRLETLPIEQGDLQQPRVSRDGRQLAFARIANGTADIFVYDFAARNARRVTPSSDYDEQPVWSPDGSELIYMGSDKGLNTMMRLRLDAASPPVELMRETGQPLATGWSPDRRYVLFAKVAVGSSGDILAFPADDPKQVTTLVSGPVSDVPSTVFSPDGRWLTFNSARSGRDEVYVVRFRGERSPPALGGPPVQISTEGGIVIDWRRDGKEVIFRSPDNQLMAVTVDARGETVSASHPVPLFRLPSDQDVIAMTPNGDRFLLTEFPYAAGQTIHVLTNWQARIQ